MLVEYYNLKYKNSTPFIYDQTKFTEMYIHRPNTDKSLNPCDINPRKLFGDVVKRINHNKDIRRKVNLKIDTKNDIKHPFMSREKTDIWWES